MKSLLRNRPALCLLLSLVLLALVPAVLATSGVINVFAPFGSIETFPASINNHGAITGWHIDGFLFRSGLQRPANALVEIGWIKRRGCGAPPANARGLRVCTQNFFFQILTHLLFV